MVFYEFLNIGVKAVMCGQSPIEPRQKTTVVVVVAAAAAAVAVVVVIIN